jgi:peptide/nickel transport system substrate-binding protein
MSFINRISSSRRVIAAAMLLPMTVGGLASSARAADNSTSANTLSIGWTTETQTLDPAGHVQNPDIWVNVNIYGQLIRVGADGKSLNPDLATSWNISKDGLTYTFHIRPNAVFQDGSKLTAEDIRYDFVRAASPAQSWSWTLTAIKSVAAPDPSTVVFTLKHPWAPFLSDVALFDTGIYPEAYFKKVGAKGLAKNPIGSGPYALDKWVPGQYLRLKKNANYWDAAKYPMAYVEYDLIPNDNTRLLKVEAGQLDVDNLLANNLVPSLNKSGTATALSNKSTETHYYTFNTNQKPFGDVKVREAISHGINRAAIIKAVLQGNGTPANSFIPAGAIDYDANLPQMTYDPTLAKKLLSQSSEPHGFTMTMELASGSVVDQETAVIFQSEMKDIGITVNIKPMDSTTLFQDQQHDKYDFTGNIWTNDIPDPDELVSFAADYTLAGSRSFFTWYNNPTVSRLSEQAEQSNDNATRQKLYYQIQQIWYQQQWFLALYYSPFVNGVSNKVHGFSENPLGYFNLAGVTKS